jgi:hypothetical protein
MDTIDCDFDWQNDESISQELPNNVACSGTANSHQSEEDEEEDEDEALFHPRRYRAGTSKKHRNKRPRH